MKTAEEYNQETVLAYAKEIQHLTTEKEKLVKQFIRDGDELTRLRELLGRTTKQLKKIKKAPFAWQLETDKLLSEINALNHKP